jgi:hypothetical protein
MRLSSIAIIAIVAFVSGCYQDTPVPTKLAEGESRRVYAWVGHERGLYSGQEVFWNRQLCKVTWVSETVDKSGGWLSYKYHQWIDVELVKEEPELTIPLSKE